MEQELTEYLENGFHPPLKPENVKRILAAFKAHWNGDIDDVDDLAERCGASSGAVMFNYFERFLDI